MATGKFLKIRLGGDADAVRLREERKDRAGQEAKLADLEARLAVAEAEAHHLRRGCGCVDLVGGREECPEHTAQRKSLVAAEAALYATVYALDTMYRVAKAYAQPTGTSIDGESRGRYAMAVREEAKARELFEPIMGSLYEGREHKP